jgi:hypothetical protein
MSKEYYVAIYETSKKDCEINGYLLAHQKKWDKDDIYPDKQVKCNSYEEAYEFYKKFCLKNKVVVLFSGEEFLMATNQN